MNQLQTIPYNGYGNGQANIGQRDDHELDLADFFEHGGIALHLVSGDGTILHANQAELDLLGFSANEYIGRHIAEFHADRHVIEDILARLKRGEKLQRYPARLRASDTARSRIFGGSRQSRLAAQPARTRGGSHS